MDSIDFEEKLPEKWVAVLKMRDFNKKTFSEIAKEMGFSSSRASQIYYQAKARQGHFADLQKKGLLDRIPNGTKTVSSEFPDYFPSRIANCIRNNGVQDEKELVSLIKAKPKTVLKWKNFGRKSFNDLCKILEIKSFIEDKDNRCPYCGQVIRANFGGKKK